LHVENLIYICWWYLSYHQYFIFIYLLFTEILGNDIISVLNESLNITDVDAIALSCTTNLTANCSLYKAYATQLLRITKVKPIVASLNNQITELLVSFCVNKWSNLYIKDITPLNLGAILVLAANHLYENKVYCKAIRFLLYIEKNLFCAIVSKFGSFHKWSWIEFIFNLLN